LHRGQRGRTQRRRRQRAAEDPRGAAAQVPAAGRQSCARPPAADHPLALPPLSQEDVARALADALQRDATEPEIKAAAIASDGSVARALDLLGGTALKVRERVATLLAALPAVDPR